MDSAARVVRRLWRPSSSAVGLALLGPVAVLMVGCGSSGGDGQRTKLVRQCVAITGTAEVEAGTGSKALPVFCRKVGELPPRYDLDPRALLPSDHADSPGVAVALCSTQAERNDGQLPKVVGAPQSSGLGGVNEASTRRADAEAVIAACAGKAGLVIPSRRGDLYGGFGTWGKSALPSAKEISCGGGSGTNPYATGDSSSQAYRPGDLRRNAYYLTLKAEYNQLRRAVIALKEGDLFGFIESDYLKPGAKEQEEAAAAFEELRAAIAAELAAADADAAYSAALEAAQVVEYGYGTDSATAVLAAKAKMHAEKAAEAATAASDAAARALSAGSLEEKQGAAVDAEQKGQLAEQERRKAEAAAEEAKKGAKKLPGGTPKTPSEQPTDPNDPGENGTAWCEEVRRQISECEAAGWKTASCQLWLQQLRGCQPELVNPGEDDSYCHEVQFDPEAVKRALYDACGGQVAKPSLGEGACVVPLQGGLLIRPPPFECNPEIASGGCPDPEPTPQLRPTIFCPEPPPGMPPPPCFQVSPGTGPKPKP